MTGNGHQLQHGLPRVQHNNAIGPATKAYRFPRFREPPHSGNSPFENGACKSSLTTLPMGGGKGSSDFSPRGKLNAEVMGFVRLSMLELWRHIGPETDVPQTDIR